MNQEAQQNDWLKKTVVYHLPGVNDVRIVQDLEYRVTDPGSLTMDIYYPPDFKRGARIPAVVFVLGYPDPGFQAMLGCKQKEMGSYISWAKLAAASGLVALTYTNRDPAPDIQALLQNIRENAPSLGIDENRIGVWSCSGNVPNALSVLMQEAWDYLKCAVLCYGFMLDLEGCASVAEAAKQWGFVNPCAGKSVNDLPKDIPLFIVRAGQDQFPHLNETIDLFMAKALICNLPVTFVNHSAAPHAFDLWHDSERTREIIRLILGFTRFHLLEQVR
ncbi:MAG TPA: alpha/beta hydrolase [Blastocatellia bacterium]|nr:alpha/beta hydrolase [Blastocatellia bacterium]